MNSGERQAKPGGFDVVLTGEIDPSMTPNQVKNNLSRAFGLSQARLEALIGRPGTVIKSNIDHRAALAYAQRLEQAGALFRLVSHVPKRPAVAPATTEGRGPRLLPSFRVGPAEAIYSPVKCVRVTGSAGEAGLHVIGPFGQQDYPFDWISSISVYRCTFEGADRLELLFFIQGVRRPFLVAAAAVQFGDFPAVAGSNQVHSTRNLLALIERSAPKLALDRATRRFLDGDPPVELDKDPARLATALGKLLG